MAAAAVRLLGDPAGLSRLRKVARERAVRSFASGPLLDRWEALYHRLLSAGRARGNKESQA
jgi:hypothetical protein